MHENKTPKNYLSFVITSQLRVIISIIISVYATRLLLQALGVEEFGLKITILSVAGLYYFVAGALQSASQRFLAYHISDKINNKEFLSVYTTSFVATILAAILIYIIAVITAPLLLMNTVYYHQDRIDFLLNLAICCVCFGIIRSFFVAAIIAKEEFTVYARIHILEAMLRLLSVLYIFWFSDEKLENFLKLVLLNTIIVCFLYYKFCMKNGMELRLENFTYKKLKEILNFSALRLIGAFSQTVEKEGMVIAINGYYGLASAASHGVSLQVSSALGAVVNAMQTVFMPKITKLVSETKFRELESLVQIITKIMFFVSVVVVAPIAMNSYVILEMWLGTVPMGAEVYSAILLTLLPVEVLSFTVWTMILANGKIGRYQILLMLISMTYFLVSLMLINLGWPMETLYISLLLSSISILTYRYYYLYKFSDLPVITNVKEILLKPIGITIIILIVEHIALGKIQGIKKVLFDGLYLIVFFGPVYYLLCLKKCEKIKVSIHIKNIILRKQKV